MGSALLDIAACERLTIDRLCTIIDANAGVLRRTPAIRGFIASYFSELCSREGRTAAPMPERPVEYTPVFLPPTRTVA